MFNSLNLYEQYSAAAYCPNNNDASNTQITCPAKNCPLVQSAKAMSTDEFENTPDTDTTGFVAYDETNKVTVVSFRGSRSLANFVTDVNFPLDNTDICTGCKVHRGFLQSWNEIRSNILAAAKSAADANKCSLVVTGHSLGAAIATLCAAELRKAGYNVALYTYGSPRVGNPAFANFVTAQAGGNYRVTHTNDPVPHLPLSAMGFQHVGPEYYINTGNLLPVSASNVQMLQGVNNILGNTAQIFTDIASHLWYFNGICNCGAGLDVSGL
ncbi:alpha/beta-hydrolase [Rhizodiscina lignyota]|uniref:Alpha/beta-hydrolase n=1 Tax=Rhizodiscina lignyota TaxID=1504668 RepID=A0A9P4IHV9_9PEZI|nr:alpha/beta-hydrolase [Rhizodiscina lignyota]